VIVNPSISMKYDQLHCTIIIFLIEVWQAAWLLLWPSEGNHLGIHSSKHFQIQGHTRSEVSALGHYRNVFGILWKLYKVMLWMYYILLCCTMYKQFFELCTLIKTFTCNNCKVWKTLRMKCKYLPLSSPPAPILGIYWIILTKEYTVLVYCGIILIHMDQCLLVNTLLRLFTILNN
jgi:hypothetical protein